MKVIDCHAHYEPAILDGQSVINRMKRHGISETLLMSAMTTPAIYNKSNFLMGIQRIMLNSKLLWPIAKKIDDGLHKRPGEWDPWYRKYFGKKEKYQIVLDPDNDSVFSEVDKYPDYLKGWIFLNPKIDDWKGELSKWIKHPGAVGIKIHPFWHRYPIKEAIEIAELANENNLPLMIHMGFEQINNIKSFIRNWDNLKIIFSHAAFPYYCQLWPEIKNTQKKFVDLSSHHVDQNIISKAVSFLGAEKCLYGTDDPYGGETAGLKIQKWINSLKIDSTAKEMIYSKNIINIINRDN